MHLRKINMERARNAIRMSKYNYNNTLYLEIRNRRNAILCHNVSWYVSPNYLFAV